METCCPANESLSNLSEHRMTSRNVTAGNVTAGNATGVQSIDDILLDRLGAKRSPYFLSITLVYLLIFLTGLAGNLLTCAVIAKHKKMRTPTNLYLLSLAVSDLLVLLLGMPLEIYDLWENYPFPFGEGGCYFKVFLFEMVCFASILNVTALSVERYMAVMHPLKTLYLSTNRHAKRVITAVWAAATLCAVPNTSLHGVRYQYLPEKVAGSAICTLLRPQWIYNLVIQVSMVCFYFVPMTVISVLYLVMGVRLGRERRQQRELCGANRGSSSKSGSGSRWRIHTESGRRRQVTKMLSVVVLVFGLCWAPFHIERLMWSAISEWTDSLHAVYERVHILSGVLLYLGSAVNPVIYNLLSTRFRECFRELVCPNAKDGSAAAHAKESPHFPKVLLGPAGPLPGPQAKASDPLIPLLSPIVGMSIDPTALPCSCKEPDCSASAF